MLLVAWSTPQENGLSGGSGGSICAPAATLPELAPSVPLEPIGYSVIDPELVDHKIGSKVSEGCPVEVLIVMLKGSRGNVEARVVVCSGDPTEPVAPTG